MTKKQLNKTRAKYNRLVKDHYQIPPTLLTLFSDWFHTNCEYGEDQGANHEGAPFFTYAEIPRHQTRSGHAEILELVK